MMRRIDLLPASIAQARRERQRVTLVVVVGVALLVLLGLYWFMLGGQIAEQEERLAEAQATNSQLQAQIDELQPFALLEQEVLAKQTALQLVFAGDIDWPRMMTELAMVVPGEVWLESMQASSGLIGQAPTETAPIRIATQTAIGRVQFSGQSLTMVGVAKWLIRLDAARQFFASYLQSASRSAAEETSTLTPVVWQSSVELSNKAVSERFQRGIGQ